MQVEAMGQLLGGPAPAECVREPADSAVVKGTFWLSRAAAAAVKKVLQEEGVPSRALPRDADCTMNIRREVRLRYRRMPATKHHRNIWYLNSSSVSIHFMQ